MSDSESKPGEKKLVTIKNTADLQRLKIEKLMKNPDKPVVIPERPKQKALAAPPDFVRNVMGSSAGAGSGEFHVYRHLRRKEYARQKFIQEKSEKEKLDEEYHMKIELNKKAAEKKTAKKRAKRLRKKVNAKLKAKQPKNTLNQQSISSQSGSSSEEEEKDDNDKTKDTPEDSRLDPRQCKNDCKADNEELPADNTSEVTASNDCQETDERENDLTKCGNNKSTENTSCEEQNISESNN